MNEVGFALTSVNEKFRAGVDGWMGRLEIWDAIDLTLFFGHPQDTNQDTNNVVVDR
jgi:hypothetical protein